MFAKTKPKLLRNWLATARSQVRVPGNARAKLCKMLVLQKQDWAPLNYEVISPIVNQLCIIILSVV